MANRPITNNPVADLPENWTLSQIVSPNGVEGGLTAKHGYNYLMGKVNEGLEDIGAINEAFDDLLVDSELSEVKTASGAIVTVDGAEDYPVKDLKATLDVVQPNQYDKPWPPGGGKNKLPLIIANIKADSYHDGTWSGNTYTKSGVSFAFQTNSTGAVTGVLVNGTNSSGANVDVYLARPFTLQNNTTYICSGCPTGGGAGKYNQQVGGYGNEFGSGYTFTATSETVAYVRITIANGFTASNLLFQPMVRLATETDATFAPYENICPIYPVTEVEVSRIGKNLAGVYVPETAGYATATVSGNTVTLTTARNGAGVYIDYAIKQGLTYVLSYTISSGTLTNVRLYADKGGATYLQTLTNGEAFTAQADSYVRFWFSGTVVLTNLQLEEGSTATAYEPYAGQQCLVNIGINQWDEEWEQGGINASTGENITNTSNIRSKNYIPVVPNSTMFFVLPSSYTGTSTRMGFYDANKTFIPSAWRGISNGEFTVPDGAYFMRFTAGKATYTNDISVNYPSRFTSYYPYTGHTVYGGELDVTTGVLTSKFVFKQLTGDETISIVGQVRTAYNGWAFTVNGYGLTCKANGEAYSSINTPTIYSSAPRTGFCKALQTSPIFFFKDTDSGLTASSTLAEIKTAYEAFITANKPSICYELATPLTIQLTPQEVKMLQGINNVWSDSGDVNLQYRSAGILQADFAGEIVSKLEGYEKLCNENLLDNPFFSINQRSFTSSTGTNAVKTVDRWEINNGTGGTLALVDGEISINANSGSSNISFQQKLDFDLTGKDVCISLIDGNGTLWQKHGTVPARTSSYVTAMELQLGSSAITCRLILVPNSITSHSYLLQIVVSQGYSFTIKAVKLELGSVSTLANEVPRDYALELVRCMSSTTDSTDTYANKPYSVVATKDYVDSAIGSAISASY